MWSHRDDEKSGVNIEGREARCLSSNLSTPRKEEGVCRVGNSVKMKSSIPRIKVNLRIEESSQDATLSINGGVDAKFSPFCSPSRVSYRCEPGIGVCKNCKSLVVKAGGENKIYSISIGGDCGGEKEGQKRKFWRGKVRPVDQGFFLGAFNIISSESIYTVSLVKLSIEKICNFSEGKVSALIGIIQLVILQSDPMQSRANTALIHGRAGMGLPNRSGRQAVRYYHFFDGPLSLTSGQARGKVR